MYSLDSLSLKYFYEENKDFIKGAIVQKIQLPSRYEVILNIRNLNLTKNKKLYININPKYPHICFIDEKTQNMTDITIPKNPPMFCMQLRKYLNGSKIQDFRVIEYERIVELYFDYFDEIGSLTRLCLALEFMGKHSNIILYNANTKIITGSIHNISPDKSSVREVWGGVKYILPPQKQKEDILKISYNTFAQRTDNLDYKAISEQFYYFSIPLLEKIFLKYKTKDKIFNFMQSAQNLNEKEFMCSFWGDKNTINEALDDYFSKLMFDEILKNKKSSLKKYFKNEIKKLQNTVENKPDDKKYQNYKNIADLISTNLYQNDDYFKNVLNIELDNNLSKSENAQKYYSLYKKSKSTYEHNLKRTQDALNKLEYYEGIVFNIDNSTNFGELNEIKDEMIDLGLINDKKEKKELKVTKLEYKDYDIFVGKNNKQNDYLISKIAQDEDLWFHGLNFPSSHVILKVPNNKKAPSKEVLEFCAKLTKENSKAKSSGKTSIIMTKRKNLRKPPNTYLGYVTYKNETEIVI